MIFNTLDRLITTVPLPFQDGVTLGLSLSHYCPSPFTAVLNGEGRSVIMSHENDNVTKSYLSQ